MKKTAIAARLARTSRLSTSAAADELDRMVTRILRTLRQGEAIKIPGVGEMRPGAKPTLRPEKPHA